MFHTLPYDMIRTSQQYSQYIHTAIPLTSRDFQEMIHLGIPMHTVDSFGATRLMSAVYKGISPSVLELYLQQDGVHLFSRDNMNRTTLMYAVLSQAPSFELIQSILSRKVGGNPISHDLLSHVDDHGYTALHLAILNHLPSSIIRLFLDYKPDLDLQCSQGRTALMCALATHPCLDTITLLLKYTSDLNRKDHAGMTPLMYAIKYHSKNPLLLKALLDKRCQFDINATDNHGRSALIYSIVHNIRRDVIISLLERGALIDLSDQHGYSPLLYAVYSNAPSTVIQLMLDRRANIFVRDEKGRQLLHIAIAQNCRYNLLHLLFDLPLDPLHQDHSGHTVLDYAKQYQANDQVIASLYLKTVRPLHRALYSHATPGVILLIVSSGTEKPTTTTTAITTTADNASNQHDLPSSSSSFISSSPFIAPIRRRLSALYTQRRASPDVTPVSAPTPSKPIEFQESQTTLEQSIMEKPLEMPPPNIPPTPTSSSSTGRSLLAGHHQSTLSSSHSHQTPHRSPFLDPKVSSNHSSPTLKSILGTTIDCSSVMLHSPPLSPSSRTHPVHSSFTLHTDLTTQSPTQSDNNHHSTSDQSQYPVNSEETGVTLVVPLQTPSSPSNLTCISHHSSNVSQSASNAATVITLTSHQSPSSALGLHYSTFQHDTSIDTSHPSTPSMASGRGYGGSSPMTTRSPPIPPRKAFPASGGNIRRVVSRLPHLHPPLHANGDDITEQQQLSQPQTPTTPVSVQTRGLTLSIPSTPSAKADHNQMTVYDYNSAASTPIHPQTPTDSRMGGRITGTPGGASGSGFQMTPGTRGKLSTLSNLDNILNSQSNTSYNPNNGIRLPTLLTSTPFHLCDLNAFDDEGNTPLMIAVIEQLPLDIFQLLYQYGSDIFKLIPIPTAKTLSSPIPAVGAEPIPTNAISHDELHQQARESSSNDMQHTETLLTFAITHRCHPDIILWLTHSGIDVNHCEPITQRSPLMLCLLNMGSMPLYTNELIHSILDMGASTTHRDLNGRSVYDYACDAKAHIDVLQRINPQHSHSPTYFLSLQQESFRAHRKSVGGHRRGSTTTDGEQLESKSPAPMVPPRPVQDQPQPLMNNTDSTANQAYPPASPTASVTANAIHIFHVQSASLSIKDRMKMLKYGTMNSNPKLQEPRQGGAGTSVGESQKKKSTHLLHHHHTLPLSREDSRSSSQRSSQDDHTNLPPPQQQHQHQHGYDSSIDQGHHNRIHYDDRNTGHLTVIPATTPSAATTIPGSTFMSERRPDRHQYHPHHHHHSTQPEPTFVVPVEERPSFSSTTSSSNPLHNIHGSSSLAATTLSLHSSSCSTAEIRSHSIAQRSTSPSSNFPQIPSEQIPEHKRDRLSHIPSVKGSNQRSSSSSTPHPSADDFLTHHSPYMASSKPSNSATDIHGSTSGHTTTHSLSTSYSPSFDPVQGPLLRSSHHDGRSQMQHGERSLNDSVKSQTSSFADDSDASQNNYSHDFHSREVLPHAGYSPTNGSTHVKIHRSGRFVSPPYGGSHRPSNEIAKPRTSHVNERPQQQRPLVLSFEQHPSGLHTIQDVTSPTPDES